MTKLEALRELLEKVEAGGIGHTGWETFRALASGQGVYSDRQAGTARDAYFGSMDAALSLFDAVLPGWECGFDSGAMTWVKKPGLRSSFRTHTKDNPARALLIAILKALISLEEGK